MSTATRTVTVYWTMHSGKRFAAALTEAGARKQLGNQCTYQDDPRGWTIEQTTETVPVVRGEPFSKPAKRFALDDAGEFLELRADVPIPHVAWHCPHCQQRHTNALCDPAVPKTLPAVSPQVWFCEDGQGIVLVEW